MKKLLRSLNQEIHNFLVCSYAGAEAMFADLGHFTVPSIQVSESSNKYIKIFEFLRFLKSHARLLIQIAFTFVVFPCLLLAYMGQAAFLMKNPASYSSVFYKSVPGDIAFINI